MKPSPRQKLGKKPINKLTPAELGSLVKTPDEKRIRADYGPAWAPLFEPKRGGRPQKNAEREEAIKLREKGYSWAKVTREMNRKTGKARSRNAIRNLVSYRPKSK